MTDKIITQVQTLVPGVPLDVVSQGAEALVFTTLHPYLKSENCILKYRPPKPYRHPKIDASLTRNRTIAEAKFMHKLAKVGIRAPFLVSADFNNGLIWMEKLGTTLPSGEVSSLKNWLWHLERNQPEDACVDSAVESLCKKVGFLVGELHTNDMIHGDLTTSNILLENDTTAPCLIDFGLSSYSGLQEDKAVDLYVLERAIQSTHSVYADTYNSWVLEGYKEAHDAHKQKKKHTEVIKRLEDVRLRGRKRSMLG